MAGIYNNNNKKKKRKEKEEKIVRQNNIYQNVFFWVDHKIKFRHGYHVSL